MRVLTVPEVTAYLKDLIELDPILGDIWLRGEVTNLSRSAAGHMYFCLSADSIQINCVLFKGNQLGVIALPRNGEEVLAHGRVTLYESRGQYQLLVDNVAPEGIGFLQLQFEEVKRRLEAEGLFSTERKRPLPAMPSRIGVVTSAQGAVWHDIQTVVARRFPLVELLLAPSAVQGPNASGELVEGLTTLQEHGGCDVIIIGRGGGSAEDLAAFNDELLARAIFASRVPVVSAVGHETDVCIADLVADLRAPTPSAAAELCVPDRDELLAAAGALVQAARGSARQAARESRDALDLRRGALARQHPRSRFDRARQDVDALHERAGASMTESLATLRRTVEQARTHARLLDPRDVLRRGYAIVTEPSSDGERRVSRACVASQATGLTITFADGAVTTKVVREQA